MDWLLIVALLASAGSCLYLALGAYRTSELTMNTRVRRAFRGLSITSVVAGMLLVGLSVWAVWGSGQLHLF